MKASSTKLQHSENIQAASSKSSHAHLELDVEVWSFSGARMLVLGAYLL
jgi:hypothetical protein